jgi:hypothetical protein
MFLTQRGNIMTSKNIGPRWWQLYLTFPLLLILFVMDGRLKISPRGHQAVQIGIVLLIFGLIHLWIKANASALSRMDQRDYQGAVRVIRIPLPLDSELDNQPGSILQLPDFEIKGLLSNTADMNFSDVEPTPIHETHKN